MQRPTPAALVSTQTAIESFSLSPDGGHAAYALRTVVRGRYRSHLWLVPLTGGRPRALTHGAVRDGSPAFSPDGSRIAFVRRPSGESEAKPQIWTIPAAGGPARRVTRLKDGAGSPLWSPDGRAIAFLAEAGEDRFSTGLDPRRPKRAPTARHITRLDYRDDTSGWLGRRTHLWLVAADGRSPATQLTRGDFDVTNPAWHPRGRSIAFAADRGPDANIAPHVEILSISVPGGRLSELASLAGDADRPGWSPNGRMLAFIGTDVADPPDHELIRLWVQTGRDGLPRPLTAHLDRSVGIEGWADLVVAEDGPGPAWLSNEAIAVVISDRGRNVPHRVTLDGDVTPLVDAGRLVTASVAAADGRIAICAGRDGRAPELYSLEAGGLRQLTRNGSRWQSRFPEPKLEERWVDGPGGAIQAWLASPPSAGDEARATILLPHGGPSGSHAPGGRMDVILLCSAGYRVVMPNIRGSTSFGAAWLGALGGRWGDVDAADALAVMDDVVAAGLADPARQGVMGLSYGGYLTQWLVGVTDRFAAAVAENGVTNQVSTWGNSFFAVHYDRRASLGDPLSPEGVAQLWATSPLRNVAQIHTPLLMLQAEEDRNCPAADNEQLFAALKVLGREVEYVVYPEEHHGFKDDGRPDRRIDRMERVLAWFERWMPAG